MWATREYVDNIHIPHRHANNLDLAMQLIPLILVAHQHSYACHNKMRARCYNEELPSTSSFQ